MLTLHEDVVEILTTNAPYASENIHSVAFCEIEARMPHRQRRILVVEDNENLAFGLRINLEGEGFQVMLALTLDAAWKALQHRPDLILLDLMLPDGNGLDFLKSLRDRGYDLPVIILSAKAEEVDRITGLRLGADDYVPKPFSLAELLERVRARFRGVERRPTSYKIGSLTLEFIRRVASRNDTSIHLTDQEWRVLSVLFEEVGTPVARQDLIERAWGGATDISPRNVDYFVRCLREKLEEDPTNPFIIVTTRGVGYVLVDADDYP